MENKKASEEDTSSTTSTKNMNCAQAPHKRKWNGIMPERRHRLNEKYEK